MQVRVRLDVENFSRLSFLRVSRSLSAIAGELALVLATIVSVTDFDAAKLDHWARDCPVDGFLEFPTFRRVDLETDVSES